VVVDDALQGVTHVVRGQDLQAATSVHRVLQALLGLPIPHYHHHRLVLDADGRVLAANPRVVARLTGADPAVVRSVARTAASPRDLPPAPELLEVFRATGRASKIA